MGNCVDEFKEIAKEFLEELKVHNAAMERLAKAIEAAQKDVSEKPGKQKKT